MYSGSKMTLTLTSPAFMNHADIPRLYTCEGGDVSPPLAWEGLPADTRGLVLIIDDPDAPDPAAPKMTWVHWVLYNLPPDTAGLAEGIGSVDLPPGTLEGLNGWQQTGYRGPCPPVGRHRYFHKLYALDTRLADLPGKPAAKAVESAMAGHILASAVLIGTYQKGG